MSSKQFLKNKNIIEGIFLLIVSIFFINESFKLHGNSSWALSPALFPIIVMSLLLLFSLMQIFNGIKEERKNAEKIEEKEVIDNIKGYKKLIGFIILTFIYIIILPKVHFLLSTTLYLLSLIFLLGERNIKILLIISILTPIIVKFIFGNLLEVYLP